MEAPTFKPRLKVLNREQVLSIHEAALRILGEFGFRMEHPGAFEMLVDAGAKNVEGDWLRMPAEMVERAVESAPKGFDLYDQKGDKAMPLADGNYFYGTGSDTTFTIDLESGQRRRTVISDTANFAKLVDGLDNMSFSMSMSNPEDVPVDAIYIYAFAEMVRNTNKPLVFIADSGRDIAKVYDIACAVAGGEAEFRKRPFILNYSEAISPLRFPQNFPLIPVVSNLILKHDKIFLRSYIF